jgi:GH15 family glucan-1,4-alpha-glucosidase
MPRSVVLANGRLFVALDASGVARELTWPRVGMPHHLVDRAVRWGVWAHGRALWLGSPGWASEARLDPDCQIADWSHIHAEAGIEVRVEEAVDPAEDVWIRTFRVRAPGDGDGPMLLATHELALGQSDVGNTAYWEPEAACVVHYRSEWAAAFALRGSGAVQYSCGIAGFGGHEGTWRDADDGRLEGNPIAQGSVDSTIALPLVAGPDGWAEAVWTCALASSPEAAASASAQLDPCRTFERRRSHDGAACEGVPSAAAFHVRTVRALQDDGGAWIAAIDSDILATNRATYAYCWPRDGAIAAHHMVDMGRLEPARRFLSFCGRVVRSEGPPFLQKYAADGRLGASWHPWVRDGQKVVPWQQDETALVLAAAARYCEVAGTAEFGGLVARCADALAQLVRDDGLPLPSWDMWEERWGVHAATVCVTARALHEASRLGLPACEEWAVAAERMLGRFEEAFFEPDAGRYARTIGEVGRDLTPDSSFLFAIRWADGIVHRDEAAASVAEALRVRTSVGGLARYEGDYYFRQGEGVPGNPWVISTIWWAEWAGEHDWLEAWLGERAGASGMLAEQYHPWTGEPLSVSPLMWSHVEAARFLARKQSGPARGAERGAGPVEGALD